MKFAFLPWLLTLHFAPNQGDGGGGGAGGGLDDGGGDAGDRQHGSGGDDAAKTGVNEARVNELITKAMNSRLKASEERQAKALESATAKITESLTSAFGTQFAELKESLGTKGGTAGDKPPETDITKHPEFVRLQRAAKKSEEELNRINTEKADADARAKAATLREKAREIFVKHGVAEKHLGRLVSAMIADGQVKYDEEGKIVFDGGDGPEDLDRGVKSWVATDEGKSYLPPRGANGSGDGARGAGGGKPPPANGQNGKGTTDSAHSSAEIGQAILNQFS